MSEADALPVWERLPSRPVSASDIAAVIPDPLDGTVLRVFAPQGRLKADRYDTFVIESQKFHLIGLRERDGELLVDGEPVTEGDEMYEVVANKWRRLDSHRETVVSRHDAIVAFFSDGPLGEGFPDPSEWFTVAKNYAANHTKPERRVWRKSPKSGWNVLDEDQAASTREVLLRERERQTGEVSVRDGLPEDEFEVVDETEPRKGIGDTRPEDLDLPRDSDHEALDDYAGKLGEGEDVSDPDDWVKDEDEDPPMPEAVVQEFSVESFGGTEAVTGRARVAVPIPPNDVDIEFRGATTGGIVDHEFTEKQLSDGPTTYFEIEGPVDDVARTLIATVGADNVPEWAEEYGDGVATS